MIEIEIVLIVVLSLIGVGIGIGAFILNEVIQDLRELKLMQEERA